MPYSSEHKQETRAKIVECARILFNRHGFQDVTIDQIMREAGLTRGGFYNHFKSKEALYSAAVSSFLIGRGAQWRQGAGVDPQKPSPDMSRRMIEGYLSSAHLGDLDGQCPMIALPSDVARANPDVQASYQELLEAMVWLFESGAGADPQASNANEEAGQLARQKALSLAALCVGGMVLARSLPDSTLADEVRRAAHQTATEMTMA
ncbi:MAG: TetR family transcriptional regulator [Hyphomicrobiales bacterium]|nr:TetR/AcrR family transcriptional regulator [Hyphomicrobiales bacterium]PCJ92749.1 MAG: TetR family transcriptional regulator [Hyphomicrobiales bacterium]